MCEAKSEETKEERLLRHIKTTYQSRYSANRRLLHISKLQNISSIFNSMFVTFASALLLAPSILPQDKKDNLGFLILGLSIISLALSIVLGTKNNEVMASDFHRCGRELQSLHDSLKSTDKIDLENGYKEYNRILNSYNINHDAIDHESVKNDDEKGVNKTLFKVKYFLQVDFLYLFLIFGPLIAFILYLVL